jgi:hypothetical protein
MLTTTMAICVVFAQANNGADRTATTRDAECVNTARRNACILLDCLVWASIRPGTPRGVVEALLGDGVITGWSIEGHFPGGYQRDVRYCNMRLHVAYTYDNRVISAGLVYSR